ncbi:MAG: hypothetical protein ABIP29_04255 [Candidatus Eisenbacteria bacterium]
MTERTKTGNRRPPLARTSRGTSLRKKKSPTLGAGTGASGIVLLPWALALLGASAVLAAATVLGR